MADSFPTITINDRAVLARVERLTEDVRAALRAELPGIGLDLRARVEDNLNSMFKSRTRLATTAEMRESARSISVQVQTVWTGDPAAAMVPQVLETGAVPHDIVAKNAAALFFFWERLGINVAFRAVHHPGFAGRGYMQRAFDDNVQRYYAEIAAALAGVL